MAFSRTPLKNFTAKKILKTLRSLAFPAVKKSSRRYLNKLSSFLKNAILVATVTNK